MPESISIELTYRGSEVDDGTMPVEDMLNALAGFSGAILKLARFEKLPDPQHRIRVAGLQKGSAKILFEVLDWVTKNPIAAGVIATTTTGVAAGAYKVIKDLFGIINGKKALKGEPITNNVTYIDNRVIVNGLPLTTSQFEVLRSGELDEDLERLAAPLTRGRGVESFQLKVGEESVQLSANELPYFVRQLESREVRPRPGRIFLDTTEEENAWLEGTFKSHSKRTNRGQFETMTGQRIRYHYVGKDMGSFVRWYASGGTVKVFGTVEYDERHEPISMKIREIQPSNPPLGQVASG